MKALVTWQVSVEVVVDDAVVDGVLTDEWRQQFYQLHTPEDVAHHIAYNLVRGSRLHSLDGFADRSDDEATVTSEDWDVSDVEVLGKRPKPKRAKQHRSKP